MRITLVTPAGRESRNGNRNTAVRWARMLRALGHRAKVQVRWDGSSTDVLLALHARKSHESIARFAARHPEQYLILALTGTDLYRDIRVDADARRSLELATRLVLLQDEGLAELSPALRAKSDVVYQSAQPMARRPALRDAFEVLVIGHLREEKDPFRAALALGHLPTDSRIRVHHFGKALDAAHGQFALDLQSREPRYRWLGERPHWQVRQHLARARVLVMSSRMEGGANAVSEAIAAGCPVIASQVPGNVGMLGRDYDGYYPVEDERALAHLLQRAERDSAFLAQLARQCEARRARMTPAAEQEALARVIAAAGQGG